MNVEILKALMELFAIITYGDGKKDELGLIRAKEVVLLFLRQQLGLNRTGDYLEMYSSFLEENFARKSSAEGNQKRASGNAVRILKICARINKELSQKDKLFVTMRMFEYLDAVSSKDERQREFVFQAAESFNIKQNVASDLYKLTSAKEHIPFEGQNFVFAQSNGSSTDNSIYSLAEPALNGLLIFYLVEGENLFFMKYLGDESLTLNGQPMPPRWCHVFSEGSSVRGGKISPIYFSDVMYKLLSSGIKTETTFAADNITYFFKKGKKQALHPLTISEKSGNLIGIMGGSGSGKSTLLNILNGNLKPSQGKVTINGFDIHAKNNNIKGVIGFVAQDDLLIEELTVYQNLYYNAKLSFGGMAESEISERVNSTLKSLGLFEARDLKVGSPMDKTISGGQRKRLNIALELIREPSVMFVDEPTSGLSSRDSENIMDLLKELTLRGKLVFVVIHQPSSDIFRMFNKLLVLDQGGFPIYFDQPVESIRYFRELIDHVNSSECQCPSCGNVNPEQLFNIVEAKVVDEYGRTTDERRYSPKEWNNFYLKGPGRDAKLRVKEGNLPEAEYKIPGRLKQFTVFFTRDILSKVVNRQYVLINLLEAPALGFILSFFLKYFIVVDNQPVYVFYKNPNIPQYLFISVIVALFLGLTVSAEEIFRDKKILKREKFLSLSKGAYLWSKISIMFLISAIQMALYVIVANSILEIKGMDFYFWIVLFSTSCFANLMGLNISATFNSAKVIYILVPILIIPQLLFSGVIVKFDRLHPLFADNTKVPALGNVMASRWAYEAMAVHQFIFNEHNWKDYSATSHLRDCEYHRDRLLSDKLPARLAKLIKSAETTSLDAESKSEFWRIFNDVIWLIDVAKKNIHEIEEAQQSNPEYKEILSRMPGLKLYTGTEKISVDALRPSTESDLVLSQTKAAMTGLQVLYNDMANYYGGIRENVMGKIAAEGNPSITQEKFHNESLKEFVLGENDKRENMAKGKTIFGDNEITSNHAYITPKPSLFMSAHFYAPKKHLFYQEMWTSAANMIVVWFMTGLLIMLLYIDGLRKMLEFSPRDYFSKNE